MKKIISQQKRTDHVSRQTLIKLKGLFDFEARSPDELSFKSDEILLLIDDSRKSFFWFLSFESCLLLCLDPNWWKASCHGEAGLNLSMNESLQEKIFILGFVPWNYVERLID